MPKFDYRCKNCNFEFEVEKSYTDDSITKCPKCRSKQVRKIIRSATTVIYIGDGFTKANQQLAD